MSAIKTIKEVENFVNGLLIETLREAAKRNENATKSERIHVLRRIAREINMIKRDI